MDRRVFLIVLDSFGIGYEPDAEEYGDVGSNTLATIAESSHFHVPQMQQLGLFNIDQVECGVKVESPLGAYARLQEKSKGKIQILKWQRPQVMCQKNSLVLPMIPPCKTLSMTHRP